jgi:hypothetical protein
MPPTLNCMAANVTNTASALRIAGSFQGTSLSPFAST